MERIYGIFSYRLRAGQTSIQPRFNVFPARRRISGSCIFREKSRVRIKLVIVRPDEYNGSDILSFLSILDVPTFANLCFSFTCSYRSFISISVFFRVSIKLIRATVFVANNERSRLQERFAF